MLAARIEGLSRTRLKALILQGMVAISGRTIRDPGQRVNAGDAISVKVPPPEPAEPQAEIIPLNIVYEDDAIIVIDKPAGLVVHPAAGHQTGTLVNALIAHCGDTLSGIGGVKRPGIVHRLDKDTSGLMVIAKTDRAHKKLATQFADHGRTGPLRARLSRFRLGGAGAPERNDRRADRPASACARQDGGACQRARSDHALAGAGALCRRRSQAGGQPDRMPAGNRPHPSDPGASGASRPPAAGGRNLRPGLPDQGRLCSRRRRARRWRILEDRLCMLISWPSNTPSHHQMLEFRSELPADLARLRLALAASGANSSADRVKK